MSPSTHALHDWTRRISLMVLLFLALASSARAQAPFTVGPISAAPGTIASGELPVPARTGDPGTTIPISIVHGARPGPVLALVAGTHGMEYTPILALQRVLKSVDPTTLTGTLFWCTSRTCRPSWAGRSTTRPSTART